MPSSLAKELDKLTSVDVFCHGKKVGTIAQLNRQPTTFFSYDSAWLADGFSISPFSLPLQAGVFAADANAQDGIFGIFRDSLPDDWGRAVQDRRVANLGLRLARRLVRASCRDCVWRGARGHFVLAFRLARRKAARKTQSQQNVL